MLVHKYVMNAISKIVASGVSFISLMVMTRYVGDQYGIMMWGMSFVAVFNAVSDLGFHTANIKSVAEGRDQNACFSSYFAVKMILTAIMVAVSVISISISAMGGHVERETLQVVAIFIAYFVVQNLQTVMTGMFDGRIESGKSSLVFMTEYVSRSIILIVLALMQVSVTVLSSAYLAGTLVSLAMTILFFRRPKVTFVRPKYIREYAMFAAPLSVSMVLLSALSYLDKVLVGIYDGSLEVGYYAAAMGVVWAFTSFGDSLNRIILPHLSKYDLYDKESGAEEVIWRSEKYMAMLIFPLVAMLMVLGPELSIILFGAGYSQAGVILSYHSVLIAAFVFTGILSQVLYAANKASLYGKAVVTFSAITVVCYAVLIPDEILGIQMLNLGGVGAALSLSIGYVFLTVLIAYLIRSTVGIRTYKGFWKHLASLILTVAILFAFTYFVNVSGIWTVMLTALLCVSLYVGMIFVAGELSREDVRFVLDAINPKKIRDSLSEEMR